MNTTAITHTLGIDVSKRSLDGCLLDNRTGSLLWEGSLPNDSFAIPPLMDALHRVSASPESVLCVMEATGRYSEQLAALLRRCGFRAAIVNPSQIKHFGRSLNVRTKTDKADARIIARYGRERSPVPTRPLNDLEMELRDLTRELSAQVDDRSRLRLRRSEAQSPWLDSQLKEQIRELDVRIAAIEARALALCKADAAMARNLDLLCTIPGIQVRTALRVLSEIAGKDFQSARQMAAYAGVTPSDHLSGSSVRGRARISKIGNARLRKALYMSAHVARRYCQPLRDWADDLIGRGKAKKAVIIAVMRRLLHIAFGILKHQTPFDPNRAAIRYTP